LPLRAALYIRDSIGCPVIPESRAAGATSTVAPHSPTQIGRARS